MKKTFGYSVDLDERTEILFRHSELLGEGNNGVVYRLPGDMLIKIFYDEKICKDEGSILLKCKGSKYFPKVRKVGEKYIVRDMIYGKQLDKYIKINGLSKRLTYNIEEMLDEFKKLGFSKLDARCKDIYVINENEDIMLIDPKKSFKRKVNYPRHLMKGLNRYGYLDSFLEYIGEKDMGKSLIWKSKIEEYFKKVKEDKEN